MVSEHSNLKDHRLIEKVKLYYPLDFLMWRCTKWWTTIKAERILYMDLSDSHLPNVILHLKKRKNSLWNKKNDTYMQTIYYLELETQFRKDLNISVPEYENRKKFRTTS